MDNVGIVVEDMDAAIEFFTELGLDIEGRAPAAPKEFSSGWPNSSDNKR
jgi:catechol 2,3-dioxygenase-like lactoylglutathione lyase family enzyme